MSIWDHDVEWLAERAHKAEAVGLGDMWRKVDADLLGASRNTTLGILAALAEYLHETGQHIAPYAPTP